MQWCSFDKSIERRIKVRVSKLTEVRKIEVVEGEKPEISSE